MKMKPTTQPIFDQIFIDQKSVIEQFPILAMPNDPSLRIPLDRLDEDIAEDARMLKLRKEMQSRSPSLSRHDHKQILAPNEKADDEAVEIKLVEDQPPFLKGFKPFASKASLHEIFKDPNGSLARVARMQNALINEQREAKMQQQIRQMNSIQTDLNKHCIDPIPIQIDLNKHCINPMPDVEGPAVVANTRGSQLGQWAVLDMDAWKKFNGESKVSLRE